MPKPHVCAERVRWADVDLVGIARFSAFTRFVEHAEQEWLRAAGLPYRDLFTAPDIWMPRRHMAIDYLAPAHLDDALAMVTYVPRVGASSFTFQVDMLGLHQGDLRVRAAVTVVCVTAPEFTKRPLPQQVRDVIAPYQLDADAALAAAEPARRTLAELAIFQ
jgi:acyl-CoA thioester hydrolase